MCMGDVYVGRHMPQNVCGGRRTPLCTWFSPSTCTWNPWVKLGSSCLCSRRPSLQSRLACLSVEFLWGLEEYGVKAEAMFFSSRVLGNHFITFISNWRVGCLGTGLSLLGKLHSWPSQRVEPLSHPVILFRKQKVGEIRLPPSISATSTFLLVMFAEPMFPHPLLLTCRYHCVWSEFLVDSI